MLLKELKEFVLNTTQLTNTGKEYSIKIFYTDDKKTVVGKLVGVHRANTDRIEYMIELKGNVLDVLPVLIVDVENELQMRYLLRTYLLQNGWRAIGARDNKI
tara:strand:- start:627 stop:932 length:306 start_codon:yes stop_codon:yes gene_type:complete